MLPQPTSMPAMLPSSRFCHSPLVSAATPRIPPRPRSGFACFGFMTAPSPLTHLQPPQRPFLYFLTRPRPVKIPINNRHVFITGRSSGIGFALAYRATTKGACVSIMARSLKKPEEAKLHIKAATGVDVTVFTADVRDYDTLKKAVDDAGTIDVLLLNYGIFYALELEKM